MLLMVKPLKDAIEAAKKLVGSDCTVILPTPRGKLYKQSDAKRMAAASKDLIILCPRYEGYDERVTKWVDEQICIGQYVLTGGELPALTIIDSVVRLLPGVLGGESSTEIESFQENDESVEFAQYTRPEDFEGLKVPDVLLSGHHAEIEKWRTQN
jgi:tRNA (guanine37-N1)-methyltransferase